MWATSVALPLLNTGAWRSGVDNGLKTKTGSRQSRVLVNVLELEMCTKEFTSCNKAAAVLDLGP